MGQGFLFRDRKSLGGKKRAIISFRVNPERVLDRVGPSPSPPPQVLVPSPTWPAAAHFIKVAPRSRRQLCEEEEEEEDEQGAWAAAVWGPKGPSLQRQEVPESEPAQRNLLDIHLQGAEAGETWRRRVRGGTCWQRALEGALG